MTNTPYETIADQADRIERLTAENLSLKRSIAQMGTLIAAQDRLIAQLEQSCKTYRELAERYAEDIRAMRQGEMRY